MKIVHYISFLPLLDLPEATTSPHNFSAISHQIGHWRRVLQREVQCAAGTRIIDEKFSQFQMFMRVRYLDLTKISCQMNIIYGLQSLLQNQNYRQVVSRLYTCLATRLAVIPGLFISHVQSEHL